MADPKPTLAAVRSLEKQRQVSVLATLNDALDHHATFDAVLVAAVVVLDDGTRAIRVYTSDLNRLERLGLCSDALDALLHD